MEVQEWLGADNQLGLDIWQNKYRDDSETFDAWLDRVSGGDEQVRELIKEQKFLFGGRILANRGLENKGKKITLSNCYVVEPPEDSIESIFDRAGKLARTYSYGGGCGIDISKLSLKEPISTTRPSRRAFHFLHDPLFPCNRADWAKWAPWSPHDFH